MASKLFYKLVSNRLDLTLPSQKLIRTFTTKGVKPYKVPDCRWGQNRAARLELAAAYRGLNLLGLNEGVCNHLTVMAPKADGEGNVMLVIPYSLHWEEVTASCLTGLDNDSKIVEGTGEPELSAACIHLGIRRVRPDATVIMHTHQPYATALACMKDPILQMVHQNSTRFYKKISYDRNFKGLAHAHDEGERLGEVLGDNDVLFMGNHGVIIVSPTVALAFANLYYLERAARIQIYTESLQRGVACLSEEDSLSTYKQFEKGQHMYADAHFYAVYRKLRRTEPDFEL